jgi:tight adherence protein C
MAERLGRRQILADKVERAGRPMSLETVMGLRLMLFGGAVALGIVLSRAVLFAVLLTPLFAVVALRLPEFVLARMTKRRHARIGDRVPDLVELLVATTQAGLSPPAALRRAAGVLKGPLGDEVAETVRQIDLGTPWRQALDDLSDRTGVHALRRLATALGRSQRLGTSVGTTLHNVAEDLSGERRARAEELARRAPVKMLFPLVFLILPAFLLLTVGPVLLATIHSLH